ncbi:synaptonemal complex central element protein 2-like [Branchiostoma floridae x Branchiostoma belcheri]
METRSASAKTASTGKEASGSSKDDKMFKHPGEPVATKEAPVQETLVQETPVQETPMQENPTSQTSNSEPAAAVPVSESRPEAPTNSVSAVPTREMLNHSAQKLVDDVNSKRKRDAALMADFKKALEIQVANSCSVLESSMYKTYETTGELMQEKLQELFAVLDRVARLEAELKQFHQALGMLYTDIQVPHKQ